MGTDNLSPSICSFISRYVDSVAMLELLLFFRKTKGREWSVPQVTAELRSSSGSVQARLQLLKKDGLIEKGSGEATYTYSANGNGLDASIGELQLLYSKFPMRVIDQIYRPHTKAIQDFAEAFRLKPEGDDHG